MARRVPVCRHRQCGQRQQAARRYATIASAPMLPNSPSPGSVKTQIKEGRKFEDVVASKSTADFNDACGKGLVSGAKFVEMVAQSLMK